MQTECTLKVLYLRRFKNLFTLNLFGNHVSRDEDYRFFIAAYFPKLMFFDYRLLDEATVSIVCFDSNQSFKVTIYCINMSIIVSLPSILLFRQISFVLYAKSCNDMTHIYVQKREAAIKYRYVVEEIRCKDVQMQKADEAEQSQEAEIKLHTVL